MMIKEINEILINIIIQLYYTATNINYVIVYNTVKSKIKTF